MSLTIHTIRNYPIDSNSYIVYDKDISTDCVIIDPGVKDCIEIEYFIRMEQLNPVSIILTHEHFDHCCGCNYLQLTYNISIICSEKCSNAIKSCKSNLSIFFSSDNPFQIQGKTQLVQDRDCVESFGKRIIFYETPGHTSSSVSIVIGNALFSGDTLIKGCKTVTKLPTGSHEKLMESLKLYSSFLGKGMRVYPGHGETFDLDEDFQMIIDCI